MFVFFYTKWNSLQLIFLYLPFVKPWVRVHPRVRLCKRWSGFLQIWWVLLHTPSLEPCTQINTNTRGHKHIICGFPTSFSKLLVYTGEGNPKTISTTSPDTIKWHKFSKTNKWTTTTTTNHREEWEHTRSMKSTRAGYSLHFVLHDKGTSDVILLNTHFKSVEDYLRANGKKSKYQHVKEHNCLIQTQEKIITALKKRKKRRRREKESCQLLSR